MRYLLLLSLLILLCALPLFGQPAPVAAPVQPPEAPQPAQSNSADSTGKAEWNRVGGLVHDQQIVVSARGGRSLHCLFTGATDASLYCEPPFTWQNGREFRVDRADVEQVRLDQVRRNWKILIWSCAGAGVIWGATDNRLVEQGSARVVNGFAGGLAGGLAGMVVGAPIALFIPGKLIYRHPHPALASGGAADSFSPQ